MTRDRGFDPLHLDVAAFAAASAELAGETPLAALTRLRDLAADEPAKAPPVVTWQAHGDTVRLGPAGRQPSLHLRAEAPLALVCQRCLQPVELALQIDRRLVFVEGDDAAASLDAESDDDVLVLAPSLDLLGLLEDELLLALPIVARHAVCPQPLPHGSASAEETTTVGIDPAAHPFAALAGLKRGSLPN